MLVLRMARRNERSNAQAGSALLRSESRRRADALMDRISAVSRHRPPLHCNASLCISCRLVAVEGRHAAWRPCGSGYEMCGCGWRLTCEWKLARVKVALRRLERPELTRSGRSTWTASDPSNWLGLDARGVAGTILKFTEKYHGLDTIHDNIGSSSEM